jgi:hypothetical protein
VLYTTAWLKPPAGSIAGILSIRASVNVLMRRRISFENIGARFHIHGGLRPGQRQGCLQAHRYGVSNIHVVDKNRETGG